MRFRGILCLVCGILLMGQEGLPPEELRAHSSAYTPPAQFSLKAEARLVEVGVVVRDSRGHTVGGLTREDFEIEDSGKKREIAAFSMETSTRLRGTAPAPVVAATAAAAPKTSPPGRFLAMVFDDLSMGPGDLIPARKAAKKFVAEGLSAGDQAAIFFLSKGLVLPFTADAVKLNDALDKLTIATRNPFLPTCPNLTAYDAQIIANRQDATLLPIKSAEAMQCGFCQRRDPSCPSRVEALANGVWREVRFHSANTIFSIRSIVDYMAKLPGKRVMLMASSGFLSSTLEAEREDLVNRALHADVVINSLDAKGLYTQDMGASSQGMTVRSTIARASQGTRAQFESNDTMAILAASTGGLFFHDNNDLDLGFRELGLAPEFSYAMAFAPPGAPDGRYHNLKVKLTQKSHNSVQARPGYFAAIVPPAPPAVERKIDKEVSGADTPQDIPVTMTAASAKLPTGESGLHVVLHLDIPHMQFALQDGVRNQKLTVIAALFDGAGNFVTGKESVLDFHLKAKSFDLLSTGMNAGLVLPVAAGKYRLRGVVEDGNQGKFTAWSESVEIQP